MKVMRNILEIIIAAKDQQPATEEELRLALVATSDMLGMLERANRSLVEAVRSDSPSAKFRAECAAREDEIRFKNKKMPPGDYLGADYTPGTPENDRLKKAAAAIFEKATGKKL